MKRKNSPLNATLYHWFNHHLECAKTSFCKLIGNPLASFITVSIIAIAFIIPLVFFLFITSASQLIQHSETSKQISLFLKPNVSLAAAQGLSERLGKRADLTNVTLIDKQTALAQFKQQTELGAIIDSLKENPLPHIVTAQLAHQNDDPNSLTLLKKDLAKLPQVEQIEMDLLWIQRLEAIVTLFFKILWIASAVLAAAVALIIMNVIRWEVSSRKSELEIMRLLGGTDAYVKRPFLYSGLWLGVGGASLALCLMQVFSWLLSANMEGIRSAYARGFYFASLEAQQIFGLLLLGVLFGVAGAWIAATRYLKNYC